MLKIRQNKRVINKSMYLALGINMDGHKELLGLRRAEIGGAQFWLGVMRELKSRGLKDILTACVDGLAIGTNHGAYKFLRKPFPSDDSTVKVVYLAIQAASKQWTMPIRNWKSALNRFMIEFGDRLGEH